MVEDHDDARKYLDLFLRQLGAKVMVASNAFEGLELIKHSLADLVLSDIKMPGLDGFELLREIRALGPDAGGSVPVIAMSAFFLTERWNAPSTFLEGSSSRNLNLAFLPDLNSLECSPTRYPAGPNHGMVTLNHRTASRSPKVCLSLVESTMSVKSSVSNPVRCLR